MASKRRIRRKACGSKRKFATEKEAQTQAFRVKHATGTKAIVRAYKCPHCNCWHWGNANRGVITKFTGDLHCH